MRAFGLNFVSVSVWRVGWIFLAAWLSIGGARAASLTATLDRETVPLGESATLSLSFQDVTPPGIPAVPAPANLSIRYAQESRQFSVINGQSSSSLSYEYEVTASQPGDYLLGPFRVQVGGQTLTSQAVRLKVLKSGSGAVGADGNGKPAFLRLIPGKETVYVGETFPLEIQLYVGVNHDNIQLPQLQGDGFVFGKIPQQPSASRTQIGNRPYRVISFKLSAVAVKAGDLTLGPAQCSLVLQIPVNRRGRDLFDDFFGPRAQSTPVTLTSDPQVIHVLPLPTANQPTSFNGAVGNFSLTATASPTNLTVGDPITLRLRIAGQGNLESLPFPGQAEWSDFKLYPPTSKIETTDSTGMTGVKAFERVVIPQDPKVKELPSIQFSYFDPEEKAYRTVHTAPLPIVVRASDTAAPQPRVLSNADESPEAAAPQADIVELKPHLGTVSFLQRPLVLQTWFLALQGVPLIAWVSALLWRRRQEQLENNPRLRRHLRTSDLVRQGLKDLAQLAAANDSDAFFATVFRLLQEQLGERLDLPASAITEAVLDERLSGVASEDLVAQLHQLFQMCNQARYARHRTSQELAALVPQVESALQNLQQVPRKS